MEGVNPTTIVIFGATGDLFRKKLAPALFKIFERGMMPKVFRVAAFSRRPWSDDDFRKFFSDILKEKFPDAAPAILKNFLERVLYIEGDLGLLPSFQKTAELLSKLDAESGVCMNKLFYLATPPPSYEGILKHISKSGLAIPCAPAKDNMETGWTRILIEKPFGSDLKNALKLDRLLAALFSENQIFRIDHYLAKETLQRILKFRFSQGIFEPFWNSEHIDRVEAVIFEKGDIGGRGAFYDAFGALRDVGQNHVLQMVALVAMDRPADFSAGAVRAGRAAALKKFKLWPPAAGSALRAQYEGYEAEPGVAKNSMTETYFKIKLALATPRWRGVGFILEGGKGLPESKAEIGVYFKKPAAMSVSGRPVKVAAVKFKIQPKEEIAVINQSGDTAEISFPDGDGAVDERKNDAYEKVLLDAVTGDQTLFTSTEEVITEWKIITPILAPWRKAAAPLVKYAKGAMPKFV